MKKVEYIAQEKEKLSKSVCGNLFIGYSKVMSIISKGDVRVNNERVKKDYQLFGGEKITVFIEELIKESHNKNLSNGQHQSSGEVIIVYQDENIVIADKVQGLEVNGENSLESKLTTQIGINLKACHRLDRNTFGLVIFAKSQEAFEAVKKCFKDKKVDKTYLALVTGDVKEGKKIDNYIFKDAKKIISYVYNEYKVGTLKASMEYKKIKEFSEYSIIEIKLYTGRTHQIRAQLAHEGIYIIGDEKYGKYSVNRKFGLSKQMLACVKLKINAEENSILYGIKDKVFEKEWDFERYLKN